MRVRLVASGRVQGVGFRRWVEREANRLGVAGWVRNRQDGSVEIMGEGTQNALDALRARVREGPPGARVTDLDGANVPIVERLPQPFTVRRD